MELARSLAAAQTVPRRGDVGANLRQHVRLVRAAAPARPRVIVFPELSLTGYELDLAGELAFSERDPRLEPLAGAAADHQVTLVVGAPVRLEGRLHIGAFLVAPDGTVDLYTKHHLGAFSDDAGVDGSVPAAEAAVFRPGNRNPLVDVGGAPGAVAVCADTGHPAHARAAADRGARTYLASMFTIPSALERETAALRAIAVRHAMAVVFANHGGPTGGLAAGGGSAIWGGDGTLLARIEGTGAGIVVATEGKSGWRTTVLPIEARASSSIDRS